MLLPILILVFSGGFLGARSCTRSVVENRTPQYEVNTCVEKLQGINRKTGTVYKITNKNEKDYELKTIRLYGNNVKYPSYAAFNFEFVEDIKYFIKVDCPNE